MNLGFRGKRQSRDAVSGARYGRPAGSAARETSGDVCRHRDGVAQRWGTCSDALQGGWRGTGDRFPSEADD